MKQFLSKKNFHFRDFIFGFGFVAALLTVTLPPLRYLIYVLPVFVFFALVADGRFRLGDEAKPFVLFIAVGLAFMPLATTEGLKDIYFTLSGVCASFLVRNPKVKIEKIFLAFLFGFIVYFYIYGFADKDAAIDVTNSESAFESSFSFLFGLLAPFALAEKKTKLCLLCLLMAFLALKRIAVLGALLACFFIILGEKKTRYILNPPVMILVNCFFLYLSLLYGAGGLDEIIFDVTGLSSNAFGQGRQALYSLPAMEVFKAPFDFILFGQGPGSTYVLANTSFGLAGTAQRLHSDLIKIFFEYGLLSYCAFIALMYSSKNIKIRIYFSYLNLLFLSDNTLIYSFFIFFFVFLVRNDKNISEIKNLQLSGKI